MSTEAQQGRGRTCTPRHCGYGPGHACKRVYPENFQPGQVSVWDANRDRHITGWR